MSDYYMTAYLNSLKTESYQQYERVYDTPLPKNADGTYAEIGNGHILAITK